MSDLDEHHPAEEATLLVPGLIHELRSPLLGIKGGLELLGRRLGNSATATEEWKLVTAQLRRVEELLRSYQDLLSPARAQVLPFAVDEVVNQAVELLSFRLRRLGARFSYHPPELRLAGVGAPNALLHAITNVLLNAVDAVEETGVAAARVQLRVLRGSENVVEVRVSDEGTGIKPEARARLFEPRYTTKPEGRGTGLGLHIARTMMRNHGGAVRLVADDDPARLPWARTEFTVELPSGG